MHFCKKRKINGKNIFVVVEANYKSENSGYKTVVIHLSGFCLQWKALSLKPACSKKRVLQILEKCLRHTSTKLRLCPWYYLWWKNWRRTSFLTVVQCYLVFMSRFSEVHCKNVFSWKQGKGLAFTSQKREEREKE